METFTQINMIKEEPEEDSFTYMNLSDNFQSSPASSSYFAKPSSQIKTEVDDNEDNGSVMNLDSIAKPKEVKKRGRPKKPKEEGSVDESSPKKSGEKKLKQETLTENLNVKKKRDRFNGMPEEEVLLRLLPDILAPNLDILIIGINPGLFAAYVGHHYAGPGNHFWKCLYMSGLIAEPMNAYDDFKLPKFGIGFTNICSRTTKGSADLRKSEIKEGGEVLKKKVMKYRPRIAVFNGKGIYEVFSGKKDFCIGKQPEMVEGTSTHLFVMPSSSARCAQLPRASDKVPFFLALKKFRDYLKGELPHLDETEIIFPNVDMRHKPDVVKCDKIETESAAELTPEEIILKAEYLEALEASAEGREIPAERLERNSRRRYKGGSDDEDSALAFEDEESSQSSCSSDALRGIYNADGSNSSNHSAYCYSKNSINNQTSFEVISSSLIKEEFPGNNHEDGGGNGFVKLEKDDSSKPSGDFRATFSPKPISNSLLSRATNSPNSRSSPLYTSLGLPPKSPMATTNNNHGANSGAGVAGKHHQKNPNMSASWHPHPHQSSSPSHPHTSINSTSSDMMTTTDSPSFHNRQTSQSSPYSPPQANIITNPNSNSMPYHNLTYGATGSIAAAAVGGGLGVHRPLSQPATIPYYPNNGGGGVSAGGPPQHQMPFGTSGPSPMVSSSVTGMGMAGGQYKGGRPPIMHHQWSNGAAVGSMPPPTLPHNGTHPYYNRTNHNVVGSGPLPLQYPANPANPSPATNTATSPYKGISPTGMPPVASAAPQNGEKNPRSAGGFNGSYNGNVPPNYYAC